ncbi:MAG: hypothetical protein PHD81_01700 [Candidatus Nanoarchaeia archaeon]|nr:hypothetical protein [Candidatus Nanoarchaeia archaeon]MDD5587803.1 hypothetical protein [Candidatus Nanoarchaeia archaeon]
MVDKVEEFWKKYVKADYLERTKIIEKLTKGKLFNLFTSNSKVPKKIRKHALALSLQSYFDDLIDYLESKKFKR